METTLMGLGFRVRVESSMLKFLGLARFGV